MLMKTDSGTVRAVLRTYFIVMFALLGIFVNQCAAYLVKLKLLNGRAVNMTLMTGWIGEIGSVLFSIIKLRGVPGGWMGYLMVLSGALSKASDLAVGVLVKTEYVPSRCPFGQGLIVSSAALGGGLQTVPNNGAAYYVVAQSQLTSQSNGGPAGIYWKVNRDTTFRADAQDLIGGWLCSQSQPDLSFPPGTAFATVEAGLLQNGALYSPASAELHEFANKSYTHLVMFSNSVGRGPGGQFDVRASVSVNPFATTPKLMRSFLCQMHAPEVEWVFDIIAPYASLAAWTAGLQGIVYNGGGTSASNDTAEILERYLNSMIMIAGGQNAIITTPAANGTADETTQGCLAPRTSVPVPIIALFSAVGFVTLSSAISALANWLYFARRLRQLQSLPGGGRATYYDHVKNSTPGDLLSWMVHATHESVIHRGGDAGAALNTLPSLDEWEYGPSGDGVNATLRRRGGGKSEDQWRGNASDMLLGPMSEGSGRL